MDQQRRYTKTAQDVLDQNFNFNAGFDSSKIGGINISEEEIKIRGELESEIERNLEEEIKDGIYHLALRLHRLYQHKKERNNARELVNGSSDHQRKKSTLSEVNISIKMEGETKIEIKESIKKEAPKSETLLVNNNISDSFKRFDWAKSLRSSSRSAVANIAVNRKSERSNLDQKMLNNDRRRLYVNHNIPNDARRNYKVLELGWKC